MVREGLGKLRILVTFLAKDAFGTLPNIFKIRRKHEKAACDRRCIAIRALVSGGHHMLALLLSITRFKKEIS